MALIEIEHLKKYFDMTSGVNHAVDDTTLKVEKGYTMGVIKESGYGKSTLGRTIIHLHETTDGVIQLGGKDITHASRRELKQIREKMQTIFQDPYASLDPRVTMEATIQGLLVETHRFSKTGITQRTEELMDRVRIEERLRLSYPHELGGGWRQHIGIAGAIALNPEFIMYDEPVSTPDVSVQVQVLNLLVDLQEGCGLICMFVAHDLSIIRHISDDVSVMYLGRLVGTSPAKELFRRTLHPYTKALLSVIPSMSTHHPMQRVQLRGEITSAINPKPGYRFAPGYPYATGARLEPQRLKEIESKHFVSCCRVREIDN